MTWAMGPNFTPNFRLMGPWSNHVVAREAVGLMSRDGELGRVVRRSGGGVCKSFPCARDFLSFPDVVADHALDNLLHLHGRPAAHLRADVRCAQHTGLALESLQTLLDLV